MRDRELEQGAFSIDDYNIKQRDHEHLKHKGGVLLWLRKMFLLSESLKQNAKC